MSSFVAFKRRREVYERKIAEKNAEQGTNAPLTSYCLIVSDPLLQTMVISKWIDATDVNSVAEKQIKD